MTASPPGDTGPAAPVRTVFFGSGEFAVPTLERLAGDRRTKVVGVVSAPDRPAGRGGRSTSVPVVRRARELGLPVHQPIRLRDPAFRATFTGLGPELGVLADYGRLVPREILAVPKHGFLNLHPSLLPRHRGAAPIPATILAGDDETGVTLMAMDAGLDTGPIVAVARWPLTGTESAPGLETRAARAAAELLSTSISDWLAGRIDPGPQDEGDATLSRPLRRADGRLDGSAPAAELERRVRAFEPWPGTFIETADGRVGVHRVVVDPVGDPPGTDASGSLDAPAGTLVADGDGIALATVTGRLRLLEVQPAGGRRMTGAAWRRGRPALIGSTVLAAPTPDR